MGDYVLIKQASIESVLSINQRTPRGETKLKQCPASACCCLGFAFLAMASDASPQTAPAVLRGWVVDTAGRPVAGADLQFTGPLTFQSRQL